MELKTGAAESTLDEKGRVNIPIRFRDYFQGKLFITRGNEKCAMIMTEAVCERFFQKAEESDKINDEEGEPFSYKYLRLIDEAELDKAGRIAIPSHIRKYANLTRNCLVIRDEYRLFIWDRDEFEVYLAETDPLARTAMNKLGSRNIFKVG
jgi:MraZ protein